LVRVILVHRALAYRCFTYTSTYSAEASMCSMPRLYIACVAGASALRAMDVDERRVLLIGCSLDRNALQDYCHDHGEQTVETAEPLQTIRCFDKELNTRMGYIFHPGVGINGDLHKPTALAKGKSTGAILKKFANATAFGILKASPHLVVVDTSLWDLMGWRLGTPHGAGLPPPQPEPVTEERFQQWCQHDMPLLMRKVSKYFPTSRIAFRTAPTIDRTPKYEKFEKHDIDMLYQCISSSTENGMLLGKYEIIDYHKIMEHLIDRKVPDLYRADGYHPSWYPSRLYIHEVLRRVGLNPQDPVEPPQLEPNARLDSSRADRKAEFDPSDMDLVWAGE